MCVLVCRPCCRAACCVLGILYDTTKKQQEPPPPLTHKAMSPFPHHYPSLGRLHCDAMPFKLCGCRFQ